ncbi:Mss4-like protein [Aspergillus avenaceus]|uniref:Mss4-like protein n=1 Tax=Aspergillus avenaceus TaxID=36643 RepID=A0A5N6U6M2_ASPAV|nr:Mss4-like protein [Aspergillus avenaceus]
MVYEGQCNCGGIRVQVAQRPGASLVCHCRNCGRSGGGASINYVLDEQEVVVVDDGARLKSFEDTNTKSGNRIQRKFCSICGSSILTESPKFPGKALVKASLFDDVAAPDLEVFSDSRQTWRSPVTGARQA